MNSRSRHGHSFRPGAASRGPASGLHGGPRKRRCAVLGGRLIGVVLTVLFAGWVLGAAAEGAVSVDVRGNREFTDDQIRMMLPDPPEIGRNPDIVAKRIQSAYIEKGHLLATIRVERNDEDSTVVFHINEGEPARYAEVTIGGAERIDENMVREILDLRSGDRFRPQALRRGVDRLLDRYDVLGFPFTQVWFESLRLNEDANTIDLTIHVVEGGSEEISRVKFEGLEHTREDLAVKLSGLKPGEPYSGEKLKSSYLRLTSSGIFDSVSYPTIRLSPEGDGVEALIKVLEPKNNNSFSGALGFADREGDEDRVISGLVRLDLVNIGGSLRDLHVSWKNDGQGRSETEFNFRERFLLGRRMSLGVMLEQIGLDTLYTWQSVGVESSAPVGRLWGGLFGIDGAAFGDRNTFSEGDVSNTLRLRLAGGAYFVEGREDRGAFVDFRTRYTYGYKKVRKRTEGEDETVSQHIFEVQVRSMADVSRNVHGAISLTYRDLESREEFVPLSEQFYVGGAATIRGYRENQFHGRRIAYVRSELRVGGSRRENGYVFVDAGYVFQESRDSTGVVSTGEIFPVGYGFGLRTQSRVGNIDLSFGIGDKLSLRQTKVHVILNQKF